MSLSLVQNEKNIPELLTTLGKNMGLYPDGHPEITNLVDEMHKVLSSFLSTKERLAFSFRDGQIYFEEEILIEESFSCTELSGWCEEKNIDRIVFFANVDREELRSFISILRVDPSTKTSDFEVEFKLADFAHIEVKKLVSVGEKGKGKAGRDKHQATVKRYELATAVISDIFDKTRDKETIDQGKVKGIVDWLVKGVLRKDSSFVALASLKSFDDYTCHHSVNVAILAVSLGVKIGLEGEQLSWLGTGALLHDIGKISIPKKILNKSGKLSAKEWKIIKSHPVESMRILSGWPSIEKTALIISYEHHMGCDLSGYPESMNGKKPHIFSRLVQVADVYDGLTSERAYHEPFSPAEALNYMLYKIEKGLDQTLVKLLVQ
ncbi:MAG TPA: HD domain-containing protein [Actinobacteria bacterium]|nr:HD domain-containing protein [Actinomycetota bacterium]